MHVLAGSAVSDPDAFWASLKKAYGQLPRAAEWTLAVASTTGPRR